MANLDKVVVNLLVALLPLHVVADDVKPGVEKTINHELYFSVIDYYQGPTD